MGVSEPAPQDLGSCGSWHGFWLQASGGLNDMVNMVTVVLEWLA